MPGMLMTILGVHKIHPGDCSTLACLCYLTKSKAVPKEVCIVIGGVNGYLVILVNTNCSDPFANVSIVTDLPIVQYRACGRGIHI